MTTADQVSAEALSAEAADARAGNQALNDNPNPNPAIEPGSSHQAPAQSETTPERQPYVNPRDAIVARLKAKRAAEAPAPANDDEPLLEADESGTFVPPFLKNQAQDRSEDEANDNAEGEHRNQKRDERGRFAKPGTDEGGRHEQGESSEPAKTYTLKVYGNDITVKSREELAKHAGLDPEDAAELPEATLIRAAQISLAAQAKLDEARQGRTAARPQADQPANQAAHDNLDDNTTQTPPADQRARVREVVEKIQFGDPDEGATALEQLVREAAQDVLQLTEQQKAERAAETEIVSAMDTFRTANADIINDGDMQGLFFGRYVVNEVKEALVKTGKVDREAVDKLVVDPRSAMVAVQAATMGKLGISKPGDILNAAASKLRAKFGGTAPAANTNQPPQTPQRPAALNDRLAMKRGLVSQPSRAAAPQSAAAPKNGQDPAARSSVVAKMQQMRGIRSAA